MNERIRLPLVNFSRDLRRISLAAAMIVGLFTLGALIAMTVLVFESTSYWAGHERMLKQAAAISAELTSLRQKHDVSEPEASAIGSLRQRIASLNALDFGQAPTVTQVFAVLEELMPPAVALQTLDYDRAKGDLELVAISESSEDLTTFFDIANRSPFLKSVRLVDKKQAGTSDNGSLLFQARLSIHLSIGVPRA